MIFIASNGRLGAGFNLKNSLGRKSTRFVPSLGPLPWSSHTSQRGPKLYKLPSPVVSQVFLRSSTQPVAIWRQFPSRASACLSVTTWKLEVLAAPIFLEAYRKIARKLLMHHLIVVPGLTLNVYRRSLARATGPFSSHGSFCFVQREQPGTVSERPGMAQSIWARSMRLLLLARRSKCKNAKIN